MWLRFEPWGCNLSLDLEPEDWDLSFEAGIWALKLWFEPQDWVLSLKVGFFLGGGGMGKKKKKEIFPHVWLQVSRPQSRRWPMLRFGLKTEIWASRLQLGLGWQVSRPQRSWWPMQGYDLSLKTIIRFLWRGIWATSWNLNLEALIWDLESKSWNSRLQAEIELWGQDLNTMIMVW